MFHNCIVNFDVDRHICQHTAVGERAVFHCRVPRELYQFPGACHRGLLGRAPEENEIAQHLEMPLSEYQQLLNDTNSGQLLPFEELVADGGEPVSNELGNSPFEQLLDGQQRQTLIEAIEALPEREKLLMALYYQEELNLKEVGAVLGVTESRVSQLHSQLRR